jgi:hypothetical protein
MKPLPLTVKLTFIFINLVSLVWVIFGIAVILRLHPAFPEESFFRWGIGLFAIAAGSGLLVFSRLLRSQNRFAYWVVLTALIVFAVAGVFDDLGLVDFAVITVTLIPVILMIKDQRWYLQRSSE